MRQCGVCGTQTDVWTRFCPTCGGEMRSGPDRVDAGDDDPYESAERVEFCTQCGAVLEQGNRFCGACGAGVWEGARSATPGGPSFLDDPITMSTLCHLSSFSSFFVPFGNILGPLVVWLLRKNHMPAVDKHGKAALNFNISIAVYGLVAAAISLPLIFILIGIPLLMAAVAGLFIWWLVATVMAAVKAGNGEFWEYPFSIRFLR